MRFGSPCPPTEEELEDRLPPGTQSACATSFDQSQARRVRSSCASDSPPHLFFNNVRITLLVREASEVRAL